MNDIRVVVTGLGAVTPLGNSITEFWKNAVDGKSGAATITKFDPVTFKTRFACEVNNFEPGRYLERNEIKRSDLFVQYALYAASEAWNDCGVDLNSISPYDIGVIWGTGQGGMKTFQDEITEYALNPAVPRFSPFFVPRLISNMAAGMISMKYGLMGMSYATVSACATSNTAIMDAYNNLRLGKGKVIVTGGSEAPITEGSIGGFGSLKALSTRNDEPTRASRPFDVDRDGFVMGEGAGALVLEEYEHAKNRGAKIYAEIIGAVMTSDAYHMTASHPEGTSAAKAMEMVLKEANLSPESVDYLNAHATSTPLGDPSEIKAISRIFGNSPDKLKISATKSMTGHLLGAAGAIESILSIKSIEENVVPATINSENLDDDIPKHLKIILKDSEQTEVKVAMNNAFGFGGHNSTILFRQV